MIPVPGPFPHPPAITNDIQQASVVFPPEVDDLDQGCLGLGEDQGVQPTLDPRKIGWTKSKDGWVTGTVTL